MHPAILGIITIAVGVLGCVSYFLLSNLILDKIVMPARNIGAPEARTRRIIGFVIIVGLPLLLFASQIVKGASIFAIIFMMLFLAGFYVLANYLFPKEAQGIGDNINRSSRIRPWLFLFPAMFALTVYLAYPVVETMRLSMMQRVGPDFHWVGFSNYINMFQESKFHEALLNNFLWLLVVPAFSTAFGLIIAQLTDRIKWGGIAKSIIFMPMAISFVGASVIWKLVYDARPIDQEQIGILNALYIYFGGSDSHTWLTIPFWNSFFLMIVLIWIQTGFAMVILSAALRGIPEETVEAAIVDGAGPFQIFFKIKIPQIMGTIVVVWTTITITVLKVFDIVFAMTNGQWQTQVLANYMFAKLFVDSDWGTGSAAAMIIMLMVSPILIWNVYSVRKEMK